jgi:hypothetical protein
MAPAPSRKISITQDIIDRAIPGTGSKCMVAMALRERVPNIYSIHVTSEWVRFNIGDCKAITGIRYMYPVPARAMRAVRQFDIDRSKVKPFTFNLDGRDATTAVVVKIGPRNSLDHKRKKNSVKRNVGPVRCRSRRYQGLVAIGGKK